MRIKIIIAEINKNNNEKRGEKLSAFKGRPSFYRS